MSFICEDRKPKSIDISTLYSEIVVWPCIPGIRIFESAAQMVPVCVIPVQVQSGVFHSINSCLPLACLWQVKHQQVILRRCPTSRVSMSSGELEMIRCAGISEHHTVETTVTLELIQDIEA